MKKITLLILLFSSLVCFSQEKLMLDIDFLLHQNGNGYLRITSKKQFLYDSNSQTVDNYGQIFNLTEADFPLTMEWKPVGLSFGCSAIQTLTYTWDEFYAGKTFTGGCAPEYFYLRSPYANKATGPVGVCESVPYIGLNATYSTTGSNFQPFPSPYTAESVVGPDYRGPFHVITVIESYYANPKVTMPSAINNFTIIGCSPALAVNPPATSDTKCKNQSSGSVTLAFKSEISDTSKFLFNIFTSSWGFIASAFASKSEIFNNTYTWTGLAEGSYYIRYQSQSINNNNDKVGDTAIETMLFTIGSPAPVTFTISESQPNCHGEQGYIQVTAQGGTYPYYYMIDAEKLTEKHLLTADPIKLTEGPHKITVVDSKDCIEN